MISVSVSLADTAVHNLSNLLDTYSATKKLPPSYEFTELTISAEPGNSGTVAIGDSTVSIGSKNYLVLLSATSQPYRIGPIASNGARIYASSFYVVGSAVGNGFHLIGKL